MRISHCDRHEKDYPTYQGCYECLFEDYHATQVMLDNLKGELRVVKEEAEHLRVQLAGCGVAAMCNTLESMEQQCVDRDAYGWSASYGDVLEAVKREIKYREALKAQLALVDSNIITTWPDIAARLIAIAREAVEI